MGRSVLPLSVVALTIGGSVTLADRQRIQREREQVDRDTVVGDTP